MPKKSKVLGFFDRKIGFNWYRYKSVRTGKEKKDVKSIYLGKTEDMKALKAKPSKYITGLTEAERAELTSETHCTFVNNLTIQVQDKHSLSKAIKFLRKHGFRISDVKSFTLPSEKVYFEIIVC